jgi:hypothetical protein
MGFTIMRIYQTLAVEVQTARANQVYFTKNFGECSTPATLETFGHSWHTPLTINNKHWRNLESKGWKCDVSTGSGV